MSMCHFVICGMSGSIILLNIISNKAGFSGEKNYWKKKWVFWFPLQHLVGTFIIQRITERDMIKNVYSSPYKMYTRLHTKYPLFLSYFNKTWILSADVRKILQCQSLWESVQREPRWSMRAARRLDGQTARHEEANSRVLQFCEHT